MASALLLLAATAAAAGAVQRQTDCDERPQGIGCDRSTTTDPDYDPEQTSTSQPAGPTTSRKAEPATSLPSANGATAGAQGEKPDEPATEQADPAAAEDDPVEDENAATYTYRDETSISPLFLAVAVLFGLGAGALAGGALMASRLRNAGAPATPLPAPMPVDDRPGGVPPADLSGVGADRRRLVLELIEVRDQVGSEALRAHIGTALAEAGVVEQSVPAGTAFDPQLHKGVDRVVTEDPALDRTVAETERPGYVDRGAPVRLPEVVVHRLDGPEAAS
jgi:hypothetical protein